MVHHPSSVTPGLAIRAKMTDGDIERIEEGGTEPTSPSRAVSPPAARSRLTPMLARMLSRNVWSAPSEGQDEC
jgi:hypothetical protein